MEGVVDREHADGVVFGYGQDDEAVIQPDVIPSQPQDFPSPHARGEGDHDDIPERMRWWVRGQAIVIKYSLRKKNEHQCFRGILMIK